MYIFISNNFKHLYINATAALNLFLSQLSTLFNLSECTYNAHLISHLPDFVNSLGPLDTFSAYPFESYLYTLKKRIKSGSFVFTQSINAMQSIRHIYTQESEENKLFFSDKYPNNCCLVNYRNTVSPMLIQSVHREINTYVSGQVLCLERDFYEYPYPSSNIGIGVFKSSNSFLCKVLPVNKCILFKDGNSFIVMPYAASL